MKESNFMRVLFCKIHCPFICFCKPSAAHLYTSGPLKLENSPHVPSTVHSAASDNTPSNQLPEVKEESIDGKEQGECVLRSCIRKSPGGADECRENEKKRVQWVDNLGKELAEIKEFESSETGDTDTEEETKSCLCTIL